MEHPKPFTDDYDIPESGDRIPDTIDEIKYELDFLIYDDRARSRRH